MDKLAINWQSFT